MRSALADPRPSLSPSARRRLAGLGALAVLAAGGSVAWAVLDDPPYQAEPPRTSAPGPLAAEAAATLDDLASALADGDAEAAAALAPPDDAAATELLRAVGANARSLGLTVSLRYVDESGGVAPDGRWTADVATMWRYAGDSGTEPASAEVSVSFVPVAQGGVAIAGFGRPDAGLVPVWLSGPVVVERSGRVLVVTAGQGALGRDEAARYLRLSATAVRVVHRVLPSWPGRLVVEVPATSAGLDRAMDVEPGQTDGIAAVTVPVDGSSETDSPVHVFLNPAVFERMQPTGAQVVLSHEAVHVATDAPRSGLEPWLVEGFADYVALRDVDLPVTTSAEHILRQVRRDGVPEALPGPADFATGAGRLRATYESAWLACVLLADSGGERTLVRFYRDVDAGSPVASALRRHFDITDAELTHRWQQRLRDLAG